MKKRLKKKILKKKLEDVKTLENFVTYIIENNKQLDPKIAEAINEEFLNLI